MTAPLPPPLPASVTRAARRRALGAMLVDALLALLVSVAMLFIGGAAWALWHLLRLPAGAKYDLARLGMPGGAALLAMTALSTGGAALLLWRARRWPAAFEWRAAWRALSRRGTWAWSVGVAVALALANAGVGAWLEAMRIEVEPSNQALLQQVDASTPWLLGGFAVLLAPAYEELLFRRVLFGRLLQAGAPMLGLLLSSALFATAHEVPGIGSNPLGGGLVLWATYAVMGLGFGVVYWRTGSLPAAIACHGLHNAIALWWLPR